MKRAMDRDNPTSVLRRPVAGLEARKAIRNPGKLNAGQVNELCGTCHRFPGNKFAINWNAVWNVRHQPPYLQQSRCFQNSQGALSCFTCHEPHAALRQADSSYYAKKCAGCHNAQQHPPAAVCRKQANTRLRILSYAKSCSHGAVTVCESLDRRV